MRGFGKRTINETLRRYNTSGPISSENGRSFLWISVVAGLCAAAYYYFSHEKVTPNVSCSVPKANRIQCGRDGLTEEQCLSLMCCFDSEDKECYHPTSSSNNGFANAYEIPGKMSSLGKKCIDKFFSTVTKNSE